MLLGVAVDTVKSVYNQGARDIHPGFEGAQMGTVHDDNGVEDEEASDMDDVKGLEGFGSDEIKRGDPHGDDS